VFSNKNENVLHVYANVGVLMKAALLYHRKPFAIESDEVLIFILFI